MGNLYQASAGTIVVGQVSSPSFLNIDTLSKLLNGGQMLATSIRIDRGQDYQIVKTLSNAFYLYAMGEAPGKILIGGLLFFVSCGSTQDTAASIQQINDYYVKNNIYYQTNTTNIAMGGVSYPSYLTNLSVAIDQNEFNYGSFSLGFLLIPQNG